MPTCCREACADAQPLPDRKGLRGGSDRRSHRVRWGPGASEHDKKPCLGDHGVGGFVQQHEQHVADDEFGHRLHVFWGILFQLWIAVSKCERRAVDPRLKSTGPAVCRLRQRGFRRSRRRRRGGRGLGGPWQTRLREARSSGARENEQHCPEMTSMSAVVCHDDTQPGQCTLSHSNAPTAPFHPSTATCDT
jgi:hypothetical protein